MVDDLPRRIDFNETLKRCQDRGLLSEQDTKDLTKRERAAQSSFALDGWQRA